MPLPVEVLKALMTLITWHSRTCLVLNRLHISIRFTKRPISSNSGLESWKIFNHCKVIRLDMAGWFAEQKCTSNFNLSKNWKNAHSIRDNSLPIWLLWSGAVLQLADCCLPIRTANLKNFWGFQRTSFSWTRMCKRHTSLKEMVWDLWLGSLGYILLLSGSLGDV